MIPRACFGCRTAAVALSLWLIAASGACDGREPAPDDDRAPALGTAPAGAHPTDSPAPLHPAPGMATADRTAEQAPEPTAAPLAPRTFPTEQVQGRSGPGGRPIDVPLRTVERADHLHRRIGVATFEIAMRRAGLTEYPCSSCHTPGAAPTPADGRIGDAHQAIQPLHPAEIAQSCSSCHDPDAVDNLVLQTGERVTLHHAYRLCAQCHYRQADDWAAGAHGKRLDDWQGRRVIMGCADCHDPHAPALEKRIPFPGPRIPRTGRRAP